MRKVDRHLVRYSLVMVEVFLLWVIERREMIHGYSGSHIQPRVTLWLRSHDGGSSRSPSQPELPSLLFGGGMTSRARRRSSISPQAAVTRSLLSRCRWAWCSACPCSFTTSNGLCASTKPWCGGRRPKLRSRVYGDQGGLTRTSPSHHYEGQTLTGCSNRPTFSRQNRT